MSRCKFRRLPAGFTLIELVIVIVLLGIISVYAVITAVSPADATLASQAQKMASDIRHMQALANAWGQRLSLSVTTGANGVYSVSCAVAGASPCNASPVIDPATGAAFGVALQNGVALAGATLYVNSLGQPSDSTGAPLTTATSYALSSGGSTETISVAAQTGLVTVSP